GRADRVGRVLRTRREDGAGRAGRRVVDRRQAVALAAGHRAAVAVDYVVAQVYCAVEVGGRGDGEGAVKVVDDRAVAGAQARYAEHLTIGGDVHIGETLQQIGRADRVGRVLRTRREDGAGRAGRRVIDRRQAVALAAGHRAAVAVDHVVAQGHCAVEVGGRGDGESAIAVVHHAAVTGAEARYAEHLTVGGDVHIGEALQQIGRADRVGRVLRTRRQHGAGGAGRCVIDRRQAVALVASHRAAVAIDHVVAQGDRAVEVGGRGDGEGAVKVVE